MKIQDRQNATPRPWRVEKSVGSYWIVKGAGGQSIGGFMGPADAQLIVDAVNQYRSALPEPTLPDPTMVSRNG